MEGVSGCEDFSPLIEFILTDYKVNSEYLALSFPHLSHVTWNYVARTFSSNVDLYLGLPSLKIFEEILFL